MTSNAQETAKALSDDAQLIVRMLPFGGHVRLRPSTLERIAKEDASAAASPFVWGPVGDPATDDDDDIEGFTLLESQLTSFFRASGSSRTESKDRVAAALTELTLRDLVKVFQDEAEDPRYALTADGAQVQAVLASAG